MVVLGTVGTTILFESLSNLIGRARPPTQIWIILKVPGFPSGHALSVVPSSGFWLTCCTQNALCIWKGMVIAVAIILMLFVGFTRVFTADIT